MALRASTRLGILKTIATAVRTAMQPGSPGIEERLSALPRLVRATLSGEYAGTSKGHLALVGAGVLYVVSPLDLVPEGLFSVLGVADDAVVLSWVVASLVNDTETFLAWERAQAGTGRSPSDRPSAGPQDSVPQPVRPDVFG